MWYESLYVLNPYALRKQSDGKISWTLQWFIETDLANKS